MMRVPSLFKQAKYKSFEYTPRHYDPVKEEIEERTRRIKYELADQDNDSVRVSSISGSFRRNKENSFATPSYSSGLVQLILAIVLLGAFVGYLFYGNNIFYVLLLAIPVYLYFRVKGMLSKRKPR